MPSAPVLTSATNYGWSGLKATWTSCGSATGYRIYYGTDNAPIFPWPRVGTVGATEAIFTGLQASTTYTVQVVAVNADGESARSNSRIITTAAAVGEPDNYGTKYVRTVTGLLGW